MYCPVYQNLSCRPKNVANYSRPPLIPAIQCADVPYPVAVKTHRLRRNHRDRPYQRPIRRNRCGSQRPCARFRSYYPMSITAVSNPANRILHYLPEFETVGLIYCDTNDPPVYWDFRARKFLKKQHKKGKNAAVVFVCHWSQLDQLDIILSYFSPNTFTLPVDRCCALWFDSKEVQELVSSFTGEIDIVDYPIAMRDIIRSRHIYPNFNNSCAC